MKYFVGSNEIESNSRGNEESVPQRVRVVETLAGPSSRWGAGSRHSECFGALVEIHRLFAPVGFAHPI